MREIKVAIVGVGNAASALVQSIVYYKHKDATTPLFPQIGGLAISDIKIVAAFDVTEAKVGKNLDDAIFSSPNDCPKYVDIPKNNFQLKVLRGPTLDGIAPQVTNLVTESQEQPVNIEDELQQANAEIVICLLPSGADKAVEKYAEASLKARCGFINATPTLIASRKEWAQKYKKADLPLVGDDLQSLTGGTRIHKGMLQLLDMFGVKIKDTYQLDVSGGAEGAIMIDENRREMKRNIKTESIQRILPHLKSQNIASGTTDYLDFLGNRRHSFFWIEGSTFLDAPLAIDITIKSFDGPNGAATLVDVIRATKIAVDRVLGGPLLSVSAYGFKHPPVYYTENEAVERFEEFITGKIAI